MIELSELESTFAETPLKRTDGEPPICEPVIVTVVPVTPLVGAKDDTVGDAAIVTIAVDVTVPCGLVIVTGPLVAPAGTTAVSCVSEPGVNVAGTPLNVTEVAPVRCVPTIRTVAPVTVARGEKPATVGLTTGGGGAGAGVTTVKPPAVVAVPAAFVTVIGPLVAPSGTFAMSTKPALKVAGAPLNFTEVTPVNGPPLIATIVPV